MAQKKKRGPAEFSPAFLKVLKDWQKLEDKTIAHSAKMLKKSRNRLVRLTMEMIRNDSQKHKAMLQLLIDSITKEAVILSPEDLSAISSGLNEHLAAEAESLEVADKALQNADLFITRYILSYLIADEHKHHALLSKLNELKRAAVFVS